MPVPTDPDALARQARQHLEGLRAAGVEWLPMPKKRAAPKPSPDADNPAGVPPDLAAAAVVSPETPAETLFGDLGPGTPPPANPDQRRHELTLLKETVAGCVRCPELAASRTQTVFGVGPLDADLCFVGEAPGADEDRTGEPFVGAAGQLLNRIIAACGLKREEVFICNILRCRPPGNRVPKANEAANCREYLDKTLDLVRPKFLCALGATAAKHLLGTTLGIGRLRGRFHEYRGIPVLCTFHPASLLPHRSPENKRLVWDDMKMLLQRMGKPIPQAKKE
jgi:DNA polymerase